MPQESFGERGGAGRGCRFEYWRQTGVFFTTLRLGAHKAVCVGVSQPAPSLGQSLTPPTTFGCFLAWTARVSGRSIVNNPIRLW